MKPERVTIEAFGEQIRTGDCTLHQLRKLLEAVRRDERFEALFRIFSDSDRDWRVYIDAQHVAGRLLLAVRPKCTRDIDEILLSVAPTLNPDVSALPFYLCYIFGRENVISAATRLESRFPSGSREAKTLAGTRWWLTDAVTFFPNEGTIRLSVDVELEDAITKKPRHRRRQGNTGE